MKDNLFPWNCHLVEDLKKTTESFVSENEYIFQIRILMGKTMRICLNWVVRQTHAVGPRSTPASPGVHRGLPRCRAHKLWLVGGLEHFLFFHILGVIAPTDFHIFQRGRYTTNQMTMNFWRHLCQHQTTTSPKKSFVEAQQWPTWGGRQAAASAVPGHLDRYDSTRGYALVI